MNSENADEFTEKLFQFRSAEIELSYLQNWISNNLNLIESRISPGIALKLRRGDKQKVMACIATILPYCGECNQLPKPNFFADRQEHAITFKKISSAVTEKKMKYIQKPVWYYPTSKSYGTDAYYVCTTCNSIWTLVQPEHEDNGCWERIA